MSYSTKELSVRMTLVLQAIKTHVKYCLNFYDNSSVNLFWSIDNSLEVTNAIKSKRYTVSESNTFDISMLYTSLPLRLVKSKLLGLVKRLLPEKKTTFIVVSKKNDFFSDVKYTNVYTGQVKMFVRFIILLLSSEMIYINKLLEYQWEVIMHLW